MRCALKYAVLTLLLLAQVSGPTTGAGQSSAWHIIVAPNVRVSQDFEAPHVEMMLAADPNNFERLLGASTTVARWNGGLFNKTYSSNDGGYTWIDTQTPDNSLNGSGDQQVAYGKSGTAYFVSLVDGEGMDFYRSTDNGVTWSKPLKLESWDHEQIAVDLTGGPHAGRIYLTGEKGIRNPHNPEEDRQVHLLYSDDDGRSFSKPVIVATDYLGKGMLFNLGGVGATGLAVLADGTVAAGIDRYQNSLFDKKTNFQRFMVTTSSDGGKHFRAPTKIADFFTGTPAQRQAKRKRLLTGDYSVDYSSPTLAGDNSQSRYANSLYSVWLDYVANKPRLLFSYSRDHGTTWSPARQPVAGEEPSAAQFQPALAVNNQGMIGILFFDTRGFATPTQYNAYFTASTDGGKTFLPVQLVSTDSSRPRTSGNVRPIPVFASHDKHAARIGFISGFARWPDGGDYIGLAADRDGNFHAFWPDSRDGTFQIYTAEIVVKQGTVASDEPATGSPVPINDRVSIVMDPIIYNEETRQFAMPIRLKNVSHSTIYGPIRVELLGGQDKESIKFGGYAVSFRVTNAPNGKTGVGAAFDYTHALGETQSLTPNALTEPVVWKIYMANPAEAESLQLNFNVTGLIR